MPYSHPQQVERQHAFKQVRLLMPGAAALAASAGYVNSVALGFFHTPVSHMTGAISHLGLDMASGNWPDALSALAIIIGFVCGAALNVTIVLAGLADGLAGVPARRQSPGILISFFTP